MKMSYYPAMYEEISKQYLRSILDINEILRNLAPSEKALGPRMEFCSVPVRCSFM